MLSLVDEATGYRQEQEIQALRALLINHIPAPLHPWLSRFPDEFFQQMYRLHHWHYRPDVEERAQYIGGFIRTWIYEQLAPEIVAALEQVRNPPDTKGTGLYRLRPFVSEPTGIPDLDKQFAALMALMRISSDRRELVAHLEKAFIQQSQERRPLEMKTGQAKESIDVKSTSSSATIRGMDAAEFPAIPGAEKSADPVTLDAAQLKKTITEVAFAAAQDDARPVLTGVLVQIRNGRMTLASSNGFCMAMCTLPLPDYDRSYDDIVIPARTLQELAHILPGSGYVQMIITPNRSQVLFHTPQIDLVSRLIEGTYPNIYGILPKSYTTRAIVETKAFAAALKSVVPFAQDSSNITRLKLGRSEDEEESGILTIEASAEEIGANVSRIDAAIDGPAQELLFNIKYLVSVLSVIDTPETAIEVTAKTRPGLLRTLGTIDVQYVIMPMTVNR